MMLQKLKSKGAKEISVEDSNQPPERSFLSGAADNGLWWLNALWNYRSRKLSL